MLLCHLRSAFPRQRIPYIPTLPYTHREPFLTTRTRKLALLWAAILLFNGRVWHLGAAAMGGLEMLGR